jgi:hypothetical protein
MSAKYSLQQDDIMKSIIRFIPFVIIFLIPYSANAFKSASHIWIGQQIINDLEDDGMLSIKLNGETIYLSVREDIKNAILSNKSDFLMGNIGPDATPDVVVGQTSVHPDDIGKDSDGNVTDASAWNTDDWLIYLLNKADQSETAKAFVYGYLGHAAADVFGHTYVNQYAGGIFNLKDEILVEQRHIILESYIDAHLPALVDSNGNNLGNSWDLIDLDDVYATFVRDTLIFNDVVAEQYWKNPYANHLAAIYNYRQDLNELAENQVWYNLDVLVVKIIAQYYGVTLSENEAAQIVAAAQDAIDWANSEVVDNLQAANDQLYEIAKKYEELGFEAVSSAVSELKQAEGNFIEIKQELEQNLLELDSRFRNMGCDFLYESLNFIDPTGLTSLALEYDPVLNLTVGIYNSIWGDLEAGPSYWDAEMSGTRSELKAKVEGCYEAVENGIRNSSSLYIGIYSDCESFDALYQQLVKLLPDKFVPVIFNGIMIPLMLEPEDTVTLFARKTDTIIERSITHSDGTILYRQYTNESGTYVGSEDVGICYELSNMVDLGYDALLYSIHSLEDELLNQKNELNDKIDALRDNTLAAADAVHNINNAIIDLSQVIVSDVSPIQGLLRNWVTDVDVAMKEYVKATSQVMLNTINPDASAMEPVVTWFECYHLSLLGVPNVVSGCEFRQSIQNLYQAIEQILTILTEHPVPGVDDAIAQLNRLKDELIAELTDRLKEEVAEVLEDMIPVEFQSLIGLFDIQITEAVLNDYFTMPETVQPPKGLLMIPDMANRVNAEMHISNGVFNPELYSVIHNAVVLAKIALLDSQGLQDLALIAGAPPSLFVNIDNVVASGFESIDGNHQWMPISPPLPNSVGAPYYPIGRSYDSEIGFLLWHQSARNYLFRPLFTGPLSPGVDAPETIGMSKIVDESYPYKPCAAYPYPDDIYDCSCDALLYLAIMKYLL